jgi:hypothetical protein
MLYAILAILAALLVILHTGVLFKTFVHAKMGMAVSFFTGYILLQAILSWQSVFFAVNTTTLVVWLGLLILLSFLKLKPLQAIYGVWVRAINPKSWGFIAVLFLVFGYALTAEITLYDTGLYHTQAIKWIQEYAVVPGLGNIHGRFAFNSHFFIASALFTFELSRAGESILIYPLNAAIMLVFLVWIFKLVQKYAVKADKMKTIAYSIVLLFCFFLYPTWLNSPSPDIISAVLVLFALVFVWEVEKWQSQNLFVLATVIFTAIVIKLSSAFLILLLIPAFISLLKNTITEPFPLSNPDSYREERGLGGEVLKEPSPSPYKRAGRQLSYLFLLAILILTPFFIRNYYLSGYMVYPTTAIDIFNPDWKIPAEIVEAEKLHISTWAKVPRAADREVAALKMSEWLPVWWQRKSLPFKVLLAGSALSFISLFIFLKQKKIKELVLLSIVWANLLFWFNSAPDPRFVHGFLIFGFAVGQAAFLAFALSRMKNKVTYNPNWAVGAIAFVAMVSALTIRENPAAMLANQLVYPKPMASNPLAVYIKPFTHVVPQGNNRCYNADLPCLPEDGNSIVLRTSTIQSGFKTHD